MRSTSSTLELGLSNGLSMPRIDIQIPMFMASTFIFHLGNGVLQIVPSKWMISASLGAGTISSTWSISATCWVLSVMPSGAFFIPGSTTTSSQADGSSSTSLVRADDGSLPADSVLRWSKMFSEIGEAANGPFDVKERMEDRIRAAGFTNVQTQDYKIPSGTWPRLQIYKDAGRVNKQCFLTGIEGWTLYLLTKHGQPAPWSMEEYQTGLARARLEVDAGYHI